MHCINSTRSDESGVNTTCSKHSSGTGMRAEKYKAQRFKVFWSGFILRVISGDYCTSKLR